MRQYTKFFFHDFLWTLEILLKNIAGTFTHPYLTWKHLSREQHLLPSAVMLTIAIAIFNLRAPLKEGLPDSAQTAIQTILINFTASVGGFLLISFVIYQLCKHFGSHVKYPQIASIWVYTYIPTIIWFFTTQSAYLLLPPPRTTSPLGLIFTILYISFSLSLLAWKILLLWLTFQIPGQLFPRQAIFATILTVTAIIIFWFMFFHFHFWGIPFL